MTSVDSGVETGNDSNDSSIVQHENLSSNQINTVNSLVAITPSGEKEIREPSRASALLVEMVPRSLHSPLQALCSVTENYHYTEDTQSSSKILEIRFPPNCNATKLCMCQELLINGSKSLCFGKARSVCTSRRRDRYVPWNCPVIGRKLRLAAAMNDTGLMRKHLCGGASPNNHDEKGRTPLHIASCRGYTEMVELLLQHGANPNQRDCLGNTPLHLAAVTNQISVVTLLLNAGSDVLSLDQRGYNPLQLAETKLKILQNCKGEDMLKVKKEVHNIVYMLLAYLQKKKDVSKKVETLSNFYSRLTLSNTSDQVQDDVKDLLANLNALNITN
ncbi:ankyrin repeat domain-containing protein 54 isoform X1 [Calliopsis andreniformis]|uniref:ankyrin repeat domain-containing protein 54 isoform X1 n=1 Tax=Calliopsis andreniformis TaxID=337506 RepID=UPI003FCCDD01